MVDPALWAGIPGELKQRKQWCVADINHPDATQRKAPRIVGTSHRASPTNPSDWSTFEEAAHFAWKAGWAIGYVISPDDEFTCIDLDVKGPHNYPENPELWTSQEQKEYFWSITQQVDSFTEASLSGHALHIWVKAKIGEGIKHNGIEIYSQGRFIICTGNVVIDKPIFDRQQLLDATVRNLRFLQIKKDTVELVELPQIESDDEVWEKASEAANADKFTELAEGRWEQYNYPSQSEAELALMSMFTFYSPSNEQCRRLFRKTQISQWDTRKQCARKKVINNDKYLNRNLILIRSRQAFEAAAEEAAFAKSKKVLEQFLNSRLRVPAPPAMAVPPPPQARIQANHIPLPEHFNTKVPPPPPPVRKLPPLSFDTKPGELSWPPGMVGDIARFIYSNSIRPIPEVSIVAALGLFAGFFGKAYHIPQSGLNLYITLVAKSGIGKEAMHTGVGAVMAGLRSRNPTAMRFVEFSEFASGPALTKACVGNPSFVNVCNEWGRKLKLISASKGSDSAMDTLVTVMTSLFQKSGPQSVVGGISYSSKENSVLSVSGVAYSMIGESTPETFYGALTQDMMENGFLSRFITINYDGDRPDENEEPVLVMDKDIGDRLADVTLHIQSLLSNTNSILVTKDDEATFLLRAFRNECDDQIRGSDDDAWRQIWNRAGLLALRVAAILSIPDSYLNPVIKREHATWAINLIRRNIANFTKKFEAGDVGLGDASKEKKILQILTEYLTEDIPAGYNCPENLKDNYIIPRKYLMARLQKSALFSQSRGGSSQEVDRCLKSLCASGYLVEVSKQKLVKDYDYHGVSYRIVDVRSSSSFGKK